MAVSFDTFISAFLGKVSQYSFTKMEDFEFNEYADSLLLLSCSQFEQVFFETSGLSFLDRDTEGRIFNWDFPDVSKYISGWRKNVRPYDYVNPDEVIDIVSEGMVLQWMKPFVYEADGLGNFLNTKDYSVYSPSKLLDSISAVYKSVQDKYRNLVNAYSYNHLTLKDLHM